MVRSMLIVALALCAMACSRGSGTATAQLQPKSGSQVTGSATFTEKGGKVEITVIGKSLGPGQHGAYVHEHGDCSASNAAGVGGIFAPGGTKAGDLGKLGTEAGGEAKLTVTSDGLTVGSGERSVMGRAVAIHDESHPGGGIVACGTIEQAQ